jgi:nonsense-mediated mRNA decay protein 3
MGILKQKEVKDASYRLHGTVLKVTLKIADGDIEKELQREIFVVNKSITCKYCNLQKASYYNMTIQVRVPKEMQDKIVMEIRDELKRLSKKDGYSFVSGVEELKEGVDLFVGSKGAAERAINMIKDKYGATTKFSRKLYGLVEGKKSYRDTLLVSIKERRV